jgi:class 3 adenylate cyclase/tetratricopeptide (TPR) repeat protein
LQCNACHHVSPEDARFCGACGVPLAREAACPACGQANPPGQRFCNGCGAPQGEAAPEAPERAPRDYTPPHLAQRILTSRSALEGERKRVTVLFADVRHSMAMSEDLDPEEWHGILERFFEILTEGVHRFEGTVNQYTGDGIMALFGAPIAHEDHAQRACWTALWLREPLRAWADELRRTRGLSCSVRMGLHSGEVVVGKIGDDLRMDYTAQGHTVGLAARMEQLAEPGSAYLTAETARQVEGYFELRELGAFDVKGVSEPVDVFELQGAGGIRTRLDRSQAHGFSRFVGRARELEQIETALARAVEGSGQILGVVGPAGVGKSRLCHEFSERCLGRSIPVWRAHCPPHGHSLPMLPVVELTRDFFGVGERERPEEARRRIAGTLVLLDEEFREDLPLAFELARFPDPERPVPAMEPEVRRRRVLDLVRRLLQARSAREPAVLLFDDLHWIDEQSDAFLAELVDVVGETRTLLLLNFRPEYDAPWMSRSEYQQIALRPLGPEDCDDLLRDLLGSDASLDAIRARVCERSGGNPFFAEELVTGLQEAGAFDGERGAYRLARDPGPLALPETVHGVLAARVDRLGERDKRVLQAAAVIGREFSEPLLSRVVEADADELAAALDALRRAEMIHQTALYPIAEYAFKHPLTHEVALGSQLGERRARSHAAAARALEELESGRLDEVAALIANHWEQAGEPLPAAHWHRRAARAATIRDPDSAIEHWRRIRRLLADCEDADALALRTEACLEFLFTSWRVGVPEEEWRDAYREGLELGRAAGDSASLARLLSGIAGMRGFGGEHRVQVELLEEALGLARESGDFALEASLYQRIGWAHGLAGDNCAQLEWTERGIDFCRDEPERAGAVSGFNTWPWLLCQRGWSLLNMGRFDEAEAELRKGEALAEAEQDDLTASYAENAYHVIARQRGDLETMQRLAQQIDTEADYPSGLTRFLMLTIVGEAALERGDYAEAVAMFEMFPSHSDKAARILIFQIDRTCQMAQALHALGERDAALRETEWVDAKLRERPELWDSMPFLLVRLAEARLDLHGPEAAGEVIAFLEPCIATLDERGWGAYLADALRTRARAATLLGDRSTAERDLHAARERYQAMDAPQRVAQVDAALAALA